MTPISISLKGFLSYRDEKNLNFEGSSVWILTGKNGAGKSTVFDAMRFALYGSHDRGNKCDIINSDTRCDSCKVTLTFDAGGKRYRAERTLNRKGTVTRALYEEGAKSPIEGTFGDAEFKKKIENIVGLSEEAFNWAVFLQQGKAESLLEALKVNNHGNSKAYELLKQLKDMTAYDEIKDRATQKSSEAKATAKRLLETFNGIDEVTDEALKTSETAISDMQGQVENRQVERAAMQSLLGVSGKWEHLTQQQARCERQMENVTALLANPEAIRESARRFASLQNLLPLREAEASARIALMEAESKLKAQEEALANLPDIVELQEKQRQIKGAVAQLPYLNQRDEAKDRLRLLKENSEALRLQSASLPNREATLQAAAEAQTAQTLYHVLNELELAENHRTSAITARDTNMVEKQALERNVQSDNDALQTLQVDKAIITQTGASDRYSKSVAALQVATEALRKREATRGSNACAYCGQPITREQWESDYATAEQELTRCREEHEASQIALNDARNATDTLESKKKQIGERLNQAQMSLAGLTAKISSLNGQITQYDEKIHGYSLQIPADNVLTATTAKMKADKLESLQQILNGWTSITSEQGKIEAQIKSQETVYAQALSELPDDPLTRDTAKDLIDQEPHVLGQEMARQETERNLQYWRTTRDERRKGWEREWNRLPEGPDRESPIRELTQEKDSLEDAPRKSQELDHANRDQERLERELKDVQREIEALPEAARRPVAQLEQALQTLDGELKNEQIQLQTLTSEGEKLIRDRQRREKTEAEMVTAEKLSDLWKEMDKQLGQPLQNWLLKEAEGQILDYANSYLDAFSQGNLALEPRRDSTIPLDLVCRNDSINSDDQSGGKTLPISSLSGSQKFRVAVSLALAFGQLASQDSRKIQSVIIDEGFGSLDGDGQREMSAALQDLSSSLDRLIVVSHQEAFADAFSDRYHIELINGTSCPELH